MSIALMTLAFKTEVPATQKLVLLALCDSANDQGECYPSVSTLQGKCSMSDRGVQKALKELEAGGYLSRAMRTGRATVYVVTPERRSPPNDVHPRTTFTPNNVHPTPEQCSPQPPNVVHPTPERRSPITIKETSVEPSRKRKSTGSRLPDGWALSLEDRNYAASKGVDADAEAESFRDHWLADTTAKAVKADWAAAWRTWVRNSVKFARPKGAQSFKAQDADIARKTFEGWAGSALKNDPFTIETENSNVPRLALG